MTRIVEATIVHGPLPRPAAKLMFSLAASSARTTGRIVRNTALLEFGNTLEAVGHFAASRPRSVSFLAAQALGSTSFADTGEAGLIPSSASPTLKTAFAIEGLGYWTMKSVLKQRGKNRSLEPAIYDRLPVRSRALFHVGSTSALAENCMRCAVKRAPETVEDTVQSYLHACHEKSPDLFAGIAAESLGFITAALFQDFVCGTADSVLRYDRSLREYFWHGVGRGLYFKYPRALDGPRSSWSALKWILEASVDRRDRANAVAGLCWALIVVNLRHPSVIYERVGDLHVSKCDSETLVRGVAAVLRFCYRWVGWDENFERINATNPAGNGQSTASVNLVGAALNQVFKRDTVDEQFDRSYGGLLSSWPPSAHPAAELRYRSPPDH